MHMGLNFKGLNIGALLALGPMFTPNRANIQTNPCIRKFIQNMSKKHLDYGPILVHME
jgi:hypothetical protein